MEIPTHISDEWIEDKVIETQILQLKENLFGRLKWKGFKFSTHLQIAQVLIDPQIITFKPFDKFHCLGDWI
jgi:hypothetical protein